MYDIGRHLLHTTGEKKRSAFNPIQGLIDFIVTIKKSIEFKGPYFPVQRSLSAGIDQNHGKGNGGDDQRPVTTMGYFISISGKEGKINECHEESNYSLEVVLSEAEDCGHHDSGKGHCTGDGEAVSRSEAVRFPELKHDKKYGD